MRINPYLHFHGNCEEAFKFYNEVFGGKMLVMMTYGESPARDQVPADWKDKIIHACLDLGDQHLMASDAPPPHQQEAQGIYVAVHVDEPAEAERVFNALAEKGTICMPMEETFWALRFGMLVDRFGTPWMVNCSRPT